MEIPVTQAKRRLLELIRRAEAGETIVLTRHGAPVVQVVAVVARPSVDARRALIAEIRQRARGRARPGPAGARSQDFLYGEGGLPE